MKGSVTWIGLVIFASGAMLSAAVAVDGLVLRAGCETGCEAIGAGVRQSAFAALVMAMALLAWRRIRATG